MGSHIPGDHTLGKLPPKSLPERLQEINLSELKNSECEKVFKSRGLTHDIRDNQVCAVDPTNKKGFFSVPLS